VENKKVTIENENSGQNLLEKNKDSEDNKIDMNSINDMASSTGETKEDENLEENLLIENKNLVENKSDTTLLMAQTIPLQPVKL
jgi:hypothetical protein